MIGKTISHYKILEKIGEGGMGVVYKAQDTKLDRIVALKFLPKHLLCDEDAKKRFVHEAKTASALDHPNIATIYEIDEAEGECFISMAYVEGKSLKELIQEKKTKDWDIGRIIDVGIQIGEGLSKAHEKGIVHRDIKSDNIMLTSDGLAKIMDFGLAKLKGVSRVTKAGTTLGTVSYMSPEQTRGEEVDHRTDIWSLGVILYEMLTGQLPFKGDYEQAVVYSILNEEPKPITVLRSELPTELEQIVNIALSKSPDSRYQKAEDIVIDLRRLRDELERAKETPPAKVLQPSIAVLPFVDMSPEKDQEYFCDGMAEELINALTKIEKLQVASRTSAFQFKGKAHDIHEIGKKLKVQTVLEGSVRKSRDRLRITAQLVNVADGYHLWSEKYDRTMEDIFAIQDEISQAITDNLKLKLLKEEKVKLIKRYTDDLEAYDLYLKGRYFWNRRYEGGLQKGLEYFSQTIKKDPSYAPAYAGIADSLSILGVFGWLPPKESFPKAKASALKAIEIDDMIAEAYTSLGWINCMYDWDWTAAEKAFKRALEIDPNYATGHLWYSQYLTCMSRFEEGIAAVRKALELEPLSLLVNANLGLILYFKRQYDEAIEHCLKTIEMDPSYLQSQFYLGFGHLGKRMWKEAIPAFEKAAALSQQGPCFLGHLGLAYALSGQKVNSQKTLQELNEISKKRYVSFYYRALVYLGSEEKDQFFKYLERAYEDREPLLVTVKVASVFDSVRSDPRFKALLKKMGLEK